MKKIKHLIFTSIVVIVSPILHSQTISQLGAWNNNPNFIVKYYQDRVLTSTPGGIKFLDVSNPSNPVPSATLSNPGSSFPMAIEINGNFAFFGGSYTGYLMIADLSNINNPIQTGITYDITGTARQIAISGNFAFETTTADTLYSIDITNKSIPIVIGKLKMNTTGNNLGVSVRGNYAYVGTENGLQVIDITNPANMNLITTYGSGYNRISPDTLNNRLFVEKSSGFDVIDISNPTSPTSLFLGTTGSTSGNLVYKNGYVFQIDGGGVSAFQISNSSATFLSFFNSTIAAQLMSISAKDSVFYLATLNTVHVLKLGATVTGVEETNLNKSLVVYPNPTKNNLTIESAMISNKSAILIYNNLGEVVKKINPTVSNTIILGISELKNGLYFISIINGNNEERIKFIKE